MELSTLRIAWRNLGRNKKRSILALLAIAVGQFALLATNSIMHGWADSMRRAITGPMIGHAQIHAPEWREERAMDLVLESLDETLAEVRSDPEVTGASARIYAPALIAPQRDAFSAVVVGVDVTEESGRDGLLSRVEAPLKHGKVLVGYMLARKIGYQPGGKMELAVMGQGADGSIAHDLYVVQGVLKSPADLINQIGIVMNLEDAQELLAMPDQAHEIVVRCREDDSVEATVARLAEVPALSGMEVLSWKELVPELVIIFKTTDYSGYIVLVLVLIAAVAGITNTLMMSTFERMHEFGMFLALGGRPWRIVRMIAIEAVLLAALGVALGTVLGYGFVIGTSGCGIDFASMGGAELEDLAFKGLNFPMRVFPRLELADIRLGLFAVVITSLLAAVWPATVAARLEPVEAMRA